jgi:hypothetical protein
MTVHTDLSSRGPLRQQDRVVRDAVRFGLGVVAAGAVFLLTAAVWVGTCSGATADSLACGAPQRTLLALGAPAILFAGGLWAFVRTSQNRARPDASLAWQAAGWVLMTLTVAVLVMSVTPLAGPFLFF